MSAQLRILVILASLLLLMITLELVRRGKLREEYSLVFLLWSGTTLALATFAGTLDSLAATLGIDYGPSLAFAVVIVLIMLILMVQGVIISSLSHRNRDLAQKMAEQEWQIRQLRRRIFQMEDKEEANWPAAVREELAAIPENPPKETEHAIQDIRTGP